jgi:hypothetical protein
MLRERRLVKMNLPDNLTTEQSAAIVECLRILARRGEEVLRERAQRDATTTLNFEHAEKQNEVRND